MCGRKRPCSGREFGRATPASAPSTSSFSERSPPVSSRISTASTRGRRGGSHSGAPSESFPTVRAHADTASPSGSISRVGRLPRKHSVRCIDSAPSRRGIARGRRRRRRPPCAPSSPAARERSRAAPPPRTGALCRDLHVIDACANLPASPLTPRPSPPLRGAPRAGAGRGASRSWSRARVCPHAIPAAAPSA